MVWTCGVVLCCTSSCTDFQSHRLNIKYQDMTKMEHHVSMVSVLWAQSVTSWMWTWSVVSCDMGQQHHTTTVSCVTWTWSVPSHEHGQQHHVNMVSTMWTWSVSHDTGQQQHMNTVSIMWHGSTASLEHGQYLHMNMVGCIMWTQSHHMNRLVTSQHGQSCHVNTEVSHEHGQSHNTISCIMWTQYTVPSCDHHDKQQEDEPNHVTRLKLLSL